MIHLLWLVMNEPNRGANNASLPNSSVRSATRIKHRSRQQIDLNLSHSHKDSEMDGRIPMQRGASLAAVYRRRYRSDDGRDHNGNGLPKWRSEANELAS